MSGHLVSRRDARRIDALIAERLLPGERAIPSGCTDVGGCSCVHHEHIGIPCTVVGRDERARVDRCLLCGTRWRVRKQKRDPLVILETAA